MKRIACVIAATMAAFFSHQACSQEQVPASANAASVVPHIRTFFTHLGVDRVGKPHAVYFNATTGVVALCANSDVRLCASWKEKALDVVPYTNAAGNSRLLVNAGPGDYRVCTVAADGYKPKLACEQLSLGELSAGRPGVSASAAALVNLTSSTGYDTFQCAVSTAAMRCSSAQKFQQRNTALFFGHFTGDPRVLQALALDSATVCDLGGVCRTAKGLELAGQAKLLSASTRMFAGIDRSVIFGFSDTLHTACSAYMESTDDVAFRCDQSVGDSVGTDLIPFLTNCSATGTVVDGVSFMFGRANGRASTLERQTLLERANKVSQVTRELTRQAFRNAGGPMSAKHFKAAYLSESNAPRMIKVARPPRARQPDFSENSGPNWFEVVDTYDNWDRGIWSDINNHYYIDWLNAPDWGLLTRAECLAQRDLQKNMRDDDCDMLAGFILGEGLAATGVATVLVAVTGPGAGAMAASGTVGSFTAAGITQMLCKSKAAYERQRCSASCPSS